MTNLPTVDIPVATPPFVDYSALPVPSINPTANMAVTPYSPPVDWNNILQQWTGAGVSIAKAAGGANPSYQQVGPGGSVTVYGQGSGFPVTTSLMTSNLSSMILPVGLGIVALLAISKMFK